MKLTDIFQILLSNCKLQQPQGRDIYRFRGNEENFIKNGETLLEERISLFDGKTNSIRCFSVDDLNSMNVNIYYISASINNKSCRGVWNGKSVLVKIYCIDFHYNNEVTLACACREIAVAIQMGTHRNAHRLLGYCLHTNHPVLVYEWEEKGNLMDRITNYKKGKSNETLEWKDRLRIAWEIAHAVAYLHTAFRRPIIHRGLIPGNVYLDQDNSARLSDFGLSISIPEGKKHVDDMVIGDVPIVPIFNEAVLI
ncbi:non-functional pseudokinase ZED1-like isoform X2 [Silene latifolia]|uniref:non-functional pseudokinase ZED1-like isoform X2 n=1 Tax=Silene latifolia TaxID=37657 RepID=UPI003D786573